MLFAYIPQVIPKKIQVRMQKMQLQGHATNQLVNRELGIRGVVGITTALFFD